MADYESEVQRAHRLDASCATVRVLKALIAGGSNPADALRNMERSLFASIGTLPLDIVQDVIHPETMQDIAFQG